MGMMTVQWFPLSRVAALPVGWTVHLLQSADEILLRLVRGFRRVKWHGLNVSSCYTTNWKRGSVSLKVMSKNNISTQMWQEREFDIFTFSIFVFHWHVAETFSFLTQCSRSHVDQGCWGCDLPLIFGWNICTNVTLRTTSVNKSR